MRSIGEFVSRSYDYIIIGGGTAGLVLAMRLSEDSDVHVSVIEAGKNRLDDMLVDIPGLHTQMLGNNEYEWNFKTTPQRGNKNKVHHMPRGKMLGGSSGINFMVYARGTTNEYDDWAKLIGDPGWSSGEMMHYMQKHETHDPIGDSTIDRAKMHIDPEFHGLSGPIHTSFNDGFIPIEHDIFKAAHEVCKLPPPEDPWSGNHLGFSFHMGMISRSGPNKGKRSYAARDYYQPVQNRPNLHVICETTVSRILLDRSNRTATGVEIIHGAQKHTIKAHHEVILCCGTVQSPQILELSGIGDPAVLQKAGVDCLVPLPGVGANLQDHAMSFTLFELADGVTSGDIIWDPAVMAEAQRVYGETQSGPLTSVITSYGFFPCTLFTTEAELKETVASIRETQGASETNEFVKKQLDCLIAQIKSPKSSIVHFGLIPISTGGLNVPLDQSKLVAQLEPGAPHGLAMSINLQHPASRGSVHITSGDVAKPPAIDPAYFTHPADVTVISTSLRLIDKMVATSHLAPKIRRRVAPPPEMDLSDAATAASWIEEFSMGQYHCIGTCAMGDVLDSRLRVKGVKGLRVCDASVFPNHVSGNICSSVYAVAEKGADMIKEDWSERQQG
ncbi:aryl-alcohol dehydrogenase [Rhizodiscina lignyota]|uniref:Aryl-alcohol dehydrogenase n=1 Tax=Rhizodiscina lignyota TaxID=1504668 RepID=A0A9P4I712_9PEZI|nr:aryl-alcohol dehydrogenase [Rhizodiscina lignyota]